MAEMLALADEVKFLEREAAEYLSRARGEKGTNMSSTARVTADGLNVPVRPGPPRAGEQHDRQVECKGLPSQSVGSRLPARVGTFDEAVDLVKSGEIREAVFLLRSLTGPARNESTGQWRDAASAQSSGAAAEDGDQAPSRGSALELGLQAALEHELGWLFSARATFSRALAERGIDLGAVCAEEARGSVAEEDAALLCGLADCLRDAAAAMEGKNEPLDKSLPPLNPGDGDGAAADTPVVLRGAFPPQLTSSALRARARRWEPWDLRTGGAALRMPAWSGS